MFPSLTAFGSETYYPLVSNIDRRRFLQCLGLGLPLLTRPLRGTSGPPTRPRTERPHIIMVLADDMGYGDPACYNRESRIPTPRIDRLAGQGVRFTDAHSPSALCSPSRYGLLTGRYAWRTRLQRGVLLSYDPPLIEPGRLTIASLLRSSGYATAWIGKWHVGLLWSTRNGRPAEEAIDRSNPVKTDPRRQWDIDFGRPVGGGPLALGFDRFFGTAACCTSDPPYCFIEDDRTVVVPTRLSRDEWNGLPGFVPGPMADDWSEEDCDAILTRRAEDVIDAHLREAVDRPLFLVLALSSPHNPWLVPEANRGKSREGPRGDLVTVVDEAVGRIADRLEERGIADQTLLIVTSDNGAMRGASGHKSAGEFRGHKAEPWEGGHRIPFIARWPGKIRPGRISSEMISLIDLPATCAAIVGKPLPDDAAEDSRDILPALLDRAVERPLHEALVFDSGNGEFALRRGRWKVVLPAPDVEHAAGRIEATPPAQLYDIDADPGERTDRWDEHPDIGRSMIELLDTYRREGRSRPRS